MGVASKMLKEYTRLTRFAPNDPYFILLAPGVRSSATGWSAEARGNSVVVFLQPGEARRQLLARLGVILAHEIFHLWVPNSLNLAGDYDWFFEGFTLYQALRTALNVGLIDFQEYLNTIGRVYDSYLADPDRDSLSLLELSRRRWTTSPRIVYDKGTLVAFVYDLHLRYETEGKLNLSDLYRGLFALDDLTGREANEVIMSVLNQGEGVRRLLERLVASPGTIELEALLVPVGIAMERIEFKTQLSAKRRLDQKQRNLLRSLGYKG
jgi:predicted metalloprotease with PDZ domain